jgi:site-specific DNA-methyltransferase (adenine-specific)
MPSITLHQGDNLEVLATIPDNSIDSIVTDPPYGLSDHGTDDVVECLAAWMAGKPYVTRKKGGFMARSWDAWVPGPEVWCECYRVLKPGGYLLCFASTRTDDLMSIAIRLAGFRKHPFLAWITGQGMSKATNLSKMIDKQAGAERKVVGTADVSPDMRGGNYGNANGRMAADITIPSSPEAQQWDGWYYGLQSMRPAVEPILMFQKFPDRSMVDNVLHWGTGAVNIDACRIPTDPAVDDPRLGGNGTWRTTNMAKNTYGDYAGEEISSHPSGRWPVNAVTDGSPEVVDEFPVTTSGKPGVMRKGVNDGAAYGAESRSPGTQMTGYGDTGSAARFMYQAKAGRSERWFLCRDCGVPVPGDQRDAHGHGHVDSHGRQTWQHIRQHETQKPVALMRWLVRLVTPPGGTVLDPFVGSGSTLEAAELEGFNGIGIDREADFIEIARARVDAAQLPLFAAAGA